MAMARTVTANANEDEDGRAAVPAFVETSRAREAGHTISIDARGIPHSHCHDSKSCRNELGELGRTGDPSIPLPVRLVVDDDDDPASSSAAAAPPTTTTARHAYAGGFPSSGHAAVLDSEGRLWLSGCDRWQQLGMGSSHGGSSGYTWKGGRLWQDRFRRADHVAELLQKLDPSLGTTATTGAEPGARRWVRDVALGGDHTVVLSANKKDVVTFGKGGERQLGLPSRPWVSAPARSKALSSSTPNISAVCAHRHCSVTLDERGEVLNTSGKCSAQIRGMARALELCRRRARETGLTS